MLHHFQDEDEQAVAALLDAVSFVTTALRARPKRDALLAFRDARLDAIVTPVVQAFGFRLYRAGTAAEAAATAGGRRFDLIVLEAEADAERGIGRIRTLPGDLASAPILVIGGVEAQREALSEAGADGFVPEPVSPARIIDILALLLGARAEG